MANTQSPSLQAYTALREDDTIRDRQELALNTVHAFHQETGLWPTQREAHVYLVQEHNVLPPQVYTEAVTDGYRFVGRRMGELVASPDDDHPDMLEKLEPRKHTYLKENYPGADSNRKAAPHRIKAYAPDASEPTLSLWGIST